MEFSFNAYALTLIIFGFITIALAIYVYRNVGRTATWFSVMTIANAIWSIGYGLELSINTLEQILYLINFEFVGITSLPLFWFLFAN